MVLITRSVNNNTTNAITLFVPGYDDSKPQIVIPALTTIDLFTLITGDQLEAIQPLLNQYISAGEFTVIATVDTATFNPVGGGSGGAPGGNSGDIQFNNAGAFDGSDNFSFDGNNLTLSSGIVNAGGLIAPQGVDSQFELFQASGQQLLFNHNGYTIWMYGNLWMQDVGGNYIFTVDTPNNVFSVNLADGSTLSLNSNKLTTGGAFSSDAGNIVTDGSGDMTITGSINLTGGNDSVVFSNVGTTSAVFNHDFGGQNYAWWMSSDGGGIWLERSDGNVWFDASPSLDTFSMVMPNGSFSMAGGLFTISSTVNGFLPPTMTAAQRTAIATPAEGLMVYDTDNHVPYFWNGSSWIAL